MLHSSCISSLAGGIAGVYQPSTSNVMAMTEDTLHLLAGWADERS